MGKGRAPCCDKSKVKRGPWSPAEDLRLITFIQKHGHGNWRALPREAGLLRCGKSCRLRWINYLRPDVKRGNFSPEEEEIIINLHKSMGNKWSKIASHLPGRTDNEIKNVWNTHLKKKLIRRINDDDRHQIESKVESLTTYSASPSPSSSSCISYGDLNLDKGPTRNEQDQDQEGQECSRQCKASNDAGEAKRDDESVVLLTHPDEPYSQLQTTLMMTKEKATEMMIEIPILESDIDFWDMFDDNVDPKESNIVASQQPQEHHEMSQRSNLGDEGHDDHQQEEEEVGYKKWLRYLENELGLLGGSTDADHRAVLKEGEDHQKATTEKEMMMLGPAEDQSDPPTDDHMPYFPMWPSSPQDFDF